MGNPYENHNGMAYTDPRIVWQEGRVAGESEGYHFRDDEVKEKELEKKQVRAVCEDLRSSLKAQPEIVRELVGALRGLLGFNAIGPFNPEYQDALDAANDAVAKATGI